jgi:hypothetical protein
MIDYLDAPIPYIMGMQRSLWEEVKLTNKSILNEVTVFDVDRNVFEVIDSSFPDFPQKLMRTACNEITNVLNSTREEQIELAWAKKTVKLRLSILKFYFRLLGNFTKFYKESHKQKGSLSHRTERNLSEIFDTLSYLKNIGKDSFMYMKEFSKSECFIAFTESLYNQKTPELIDLLRLVKATIHNEEGIFADIVRESINAMKDVSDGFKI